MKNGSFAVVLNFEYHPKKVKTINLYPAYTIVTLFLIKCCDVDYNFFLQQDLTYYIVIVVPNLNPTHRYGNQSDSFHTLEELYYKLN